MSKTCLVVFGIERAAALQRMFPTLAVWHVGRAPMGERFDRIILLADRVPAGDEVEWLDEWLPLKLKPGATVELIDVIEGDA